MKNKKVYIWILAVIPLLMLLVVYSKLPNQVPLQWGLEGGSRYGSKRELIPLTSLNILFALGMPVFAKIDPKRKNYRRFSGTYETMILLVEVFVVVMMGLTLVESLYPNTFSIPKAVTILVGFLFLFLGNMMPKVKQNFFMGMKTPWALSSETVWNKTQRLGGKMFFFGGILMVLGSFLVREKVLMGLLIGIAILICVVPTVMSYLWYQKEEKETEE